MINSHFFLSKLLSDICLFTELKWEISVCSFKSLTSQIKWVFKFFCFEMFYFSEHLPSSSLHCEWDYSGHCRCSPVHQILTTWQSYQLFRLIYFWLDQQSYKWGGSHSQANTLWGWSSPTGQSCWYRRAKLPTVPREMSKVQSICFLFHFRHTVSITFPSV